jgi:hypothetical protein
VFVNLCRLPITLHTVGLQDDDEASYSTCMLALVMTSHLYTTPRAGLKSLVFLRAIMDMRIEQALSS